MPTPNKTQVTCHLSNDLAKKLKEAAKKDHRTVSAMLAVIVARALGNG
jgi:predicted transcriptional regulator